MTLQDQFTNVIIPGASSSHPTQNGDLSMTALPMSTFFGSSNSAPIPLGKVKGNFTTISKVDADLMYLINKHSKEMDENSQMLLDEEILMRKYFDDKFSAIESSFDLKNQSQTDFDCYKSLVSQFEAQCRKINNYAMMKHLRTFYDACGDSDLSLHLVREKISKVCLADF
jgi:hypothetical protein